MGIKTTASNEGAVARPHGLILIIRLLHAFKMAFDSSTSNEGATMSLFSYFPKMAIATAIAAHVLLKLKTSHYQVKEGVLTMYRQVLSNRLKTYDTNYIIADR